MQSCFCPVNIISFFQNHPQIRVFEWWRVSDEKKSFTTCQTVIVGTDTDRLIKGIYWKFQSGCLWCFIRLDHNSLDCLHRYVTHYERGRIALSSSLSNSSSSLRDTNILPPIIFTDKYLFARLLIFFLLTGKYSSCTSVIVRYFLLISFFSILFYLLVVCFLVSLFSFFVTE